MTDERIGLSAPGHAHGEGDYSTGWRTAIAVAWRAIKDAQSAEECRRRIEEIGNKGPNA